MVSEVSMIEKKSVLESIEMKLNDALMPVAPDQNYISHLQNRLMEKPQIQIERGNFQKALFIILLSFITGFTAIFIAKHILKQKTNQ